MSGDTNEMDGVTVGLIVKAMAEYGILGLGWLVWLYTMIELRVERQKSLSLTEQIINSVTRIRLVEGQIHEAPRTQALQDALEDHEGS